MAKMKSVPTSTQRTTGREAERQRTISENELRRMIAEEAYYIAERRAFQGGDPTQDWLQAEAQVTQRLIGVH